MATPHNGGVFPGQQYDSASGIIKSFTEQRMDRKSATAIAGQARTEIIPGQAQDALVRVFSATSTALLAVTPIKVAGTTNMTRGQLPDQIVGFTVLFNNSVQDGEHVVDEPLMYVVGSHGSLSPSARSSASAGAATLPDLQTVIKETPGDNLPCTHVFFYLSGDFTQAAVLAKLSSASVFNVPVLAWPLYRPQSLYFTLQGQQVSVSAEASSEQQASWDDTSFSGSIQPAPGKRSDGFSRDVSITNRSLVVSPTIHPALTLTGTIDSAIATVEVRANLSVVSGKVALPAIVNHPAAQIAVARAHINPTTIPETTSYPSGYTRIASAGLFLVELNSSFYDADNSFIHAVVINAAIFG